MEKAKLIYNGNLNLNEERVTIEYGGRATGKTHLINSIKELINRFENGEERYYKSALFNKVIQSLARGADPLDIISQLMDITEKQSKEFEEYVKGDTRKISFCDCNHSKDTGKG